MYEELAKRLRDISNSDSNIKSNYIALTMMQADDAIEELAKYREESTEWDVTCDPEWRESHFEKDEWGEW